MPKKGKSKNTKRREDKDRKRIIRKENNEEEIKSQTRETSHSHQEDPVSQTLQVVQGSFHQGYNIFQSENIGRQCSCNALAGLCLLRSVPCTQDIDNALIEGDHLYSTTVEYLKQQGTFQNPYLKVDELLSVFSLDNISYELVKHEPMFGLVHSKDNEDTGLTINQSLETLFAEKESGILIIKSYMMAVFKSIEGLFVMFDPHSRNRYGESASQGKSIWMGFPSIYLLGQQIEKLCNSIDKSCFQFELTPVSIISEKVFDKNSSVHDFAIGRHMTRRQKTLYLQNIKYCLDPQYREKKIKQSKEHYAEDAEYRNKKSESIMMKYETDLTYQQSQKKALKRKCSDDKSYCINKKKSNLIYYNQCEGYKKSKIIASKKKYAVKEDHRESVKKASVKKYAENKAHQEAVKMSSVKKYAENKIHQEAVKMSSVKKYAENKAHQETVKMSSVKKYAENKTHQEAVKMSSVKKYAENKTHQEAVKMSSVKKYAENKAHQEAVKKSSVKKYAENKTHQEAVKMSSVKKYAENKAHQEAVKKSCVKKYAENKAHQETVKMSSVKKYAENKAHQETVKMSSVKKYAENKAHQEAVKKSSVKKYAENKAHKEAKKKLSAKKYAENKAHKEAKKKSSMKKYAENKAHQEAVKKSSVKKYAKNKEYRQKVIKLGKKKYAENKSYKESLKQSSKMKYNSSKKVKADFFHCLDMFRKDCLEGPAYPCTSCNRLMFKNGVIHYQINRYSVSQAMTDNAQKCAKANYVHVCDDDCIPSEVDCTIKRSSYSKEWICHTCHRYFKNAQVPPEAEENTLNLQEIPPELSSLNSLERQLISLVIPFMKMVNLPKGGQKGVKGPAVCVPADLSKVQHLFPRHPSEAEFIKLKLKRKLMYKGHYEYQKIRLSKVKMALQYMKQMNPFYKNVEISETWLNSMNDELVEVERQDHESSESEEEDNAPEHGVLYDTCLQPVDPSAEPGALQDAMENIYSISPSEGKRPVYFSKDASVEMKCFPYLFPAGKYGYDTKRLRKLTISKYFNSRIMNADSRFAQDAGYIFFSQYLTEYNQITNSISIAQRKSNKKLKDGRQITAKMLTNQQNMQDILQNNSAFRFLQPIRGTPTYWERTLKDLFAAVRQLDIPTWFATFSAADFRWPEIITAIALQHGRVIDFKKLDWQEKCELLKLNPVTAARMFDHRVKSFINNIIKSPSNPVGNVVDFFYRVEFQARGSPHIHCLFWVKDAPKYGECPDKEFIKFVEQYTTCRLPNKEDEPELYDLVSKVQTHSKNHTRTCKKGNVECRFGFPKPPSKFTFIAKPVIYKVNEDMLDDDNTNVLKEKKKAQTKLQQVKNCLKNMEGSALSTEEFLEELGLDNDMFQDIYSRSSSRESIVLKRNITECWINNYNEKLLLAWNGNIDFQPVFDAYSCIMYILSYISKSERAMSKLLESAKKEAEEENMQLKQQMKKVGSAYLTHREVSVQEAVYRVLSMPLKQFTREVIFVPAHPNCTRITLPLNQIKKKLDDQEDDVNPFQPNIVDKYLARPKNEIFENLCLANFASLYKVISSQNQAAEKSTLEQQSNEENISKTKKMNKYILNNDLGTIHKREKSAVIRFPKFFKSKKPEDYYQVLLKLYLPHWNDEQLKPEKFETFEEFYKHGSVKLSDKNEVLPICVIVEQNRQTYEKNLDAIESAEKAYFEASDLEDAWAALAPANEVSRREEEEEMASELIDENEDTLVVDINDGIDFPVRDSNRGIQVEETRKVHVSVSYTQKKKNISHKMRMLNEKQQDIFYTVRKWCILKSQRKNPDPLHIVIHASGGCGKSFLIESLHYEASKILDREDEIKQNKVILGAPTGVAAFNINGLTLHKILHLPTQMKMPYIPLGEEIISQLRSDIGDVQILIIDEISMVSQSMLNYINGRLCQIKQTSQIFGGISILAFGDFYQLPPVKGTALYKKPKHIVDLWKDNFSIVTLTEIMRQKDREDTETLSRIRIKKKNEPLNDQDYTKLKSRANLPNIPQTALHIFPRNKDVDKHNEEMIALTCESTVTLQAIDTIKSRGKYFRKKHSLSGSSSDLPDKINIGVGAKVMLIRNIDLSQGLVNGAFGEVKAILMEEDKINCRAVCVEFRNETVGMYEKLKFLDNPDVPENSVCIFRVEEGMQSSSILRKQFPLRIAFACTIHKVQGLTVDVLVVSLKGTFAAGMAYVALSRVKSLNDLYLLEDVDKNMACIFCCEDIGTHIENLTTFDLFQNKMPTSFQDDSITVFHHNVEGLKSHFVDLQSYISSKYADIICLTETWLKQNECCEELASYHYLSRAREECNYYIQDMSKGGVAIFLKKDIEFHEIYFDSMKKVECLAVCIPCMNVMIMNVYRSPSYTKTVFLEHMEYILLDIENKLKHLKNIVITGDFNENMLAPCKKMILQLFNMYGYHQIIEESTTSNGTLLDLIFIKTDMNCVSGVSQSYYSYHEPVFCKLVKQD